MTRKMLQASSSYRYSLDRIMLCCAVLCCAVLCCAVLCCAVLCCAVLCHDIQVYYIADCCCPIMTHAAMLACQMLTGEAHSCQQEAALLKLVHIQV